jgi:hypothetical protein
MKREDALAIGCMVVIAAIIIMILLMGNLP